MIRSALNNVIVTMSQRHIRNFTNILRMAAIQNLSSIDPSDYVNIVGEVVSIPLEISGKREYEGFTTDNIRPGDHAIFSSAVVAELKNTAIEADPVFKNSFWYKGKEYWNCDITRLFAVIRNGEIIMQNGYVMVEHIETPPNIYLPAHIKKTITTVTGIVSSIGEPLTHLSKVSAVQGDTICFNPNILQRYQINDKKFGILSQQHILGVLEMGLGA